MCLYGAFMYQIVLGWLTFCNAFWGVLFSVFVARAGYFFELWALSITDATGEHYLVENLNLYALAFRMQIRCEIRSPLNHPPGTQWLLLPVSVLTQGFSPGTTGFKNCHTVLTVGQEGADTTIMKPSFIGWASGVTWLWSLYQTVVNNFSATKGQPNSTGELLGIKQQGVFWHFYF